MFNHSQLSVSWSWILWICSWFCWWWWAWFFTLWGKKIDRTSQPSIAEDTSWIGSILFDV